ncbi:G5 domain-containing protein [Paractinoplanes brasiliensis]|uniref:G5 domain-containing protein n=1 Tax=Paractinoplanes brasiliensis TaxID=52695 RepID=UPI001EF1D8A8|nr:G5 domain-containing protein [Actinoplanes brasiliensis]
MTYRTPHQQGFWRRLTPLQRVGLIAAALLLPCCGGVVVGGAFAGDDGSKTDRVADVGAIGTTAAGPQETEPPAETESDPATATAAETATATATSAPPPTAAVVKKNMTVDGTIPFKTRKVKDSNLAKGETRVREKGVAGVKTVTWEITYTDGEMTGRRVVKTVVKRQPVTEVVAVGTKRASKCDPNYSGCVPIASDVDCAGGSGNGPAYVRGPVTVIGDDIYDLDRDGDGVACDK